jgi:3-deoxy-D-manno-octulosonic-acid transferase
MIRLLYNILWPVGLLLLLPGYLRKMFRRGGYRRKFGQRFGLYDKGVRGRLASKPVIWLHAVSVGEVAIALKLGRAITFVRPETRFALTVTTTTGFAFAEKNAGPEMEVMYSPLDFWPIVRRAFQAIKPERLLLVEAEVWPNLMARTRSMRIPVALVNARLSPRSERRFTTFRRFVGPLFRQLDLICVPEQSDIARWTALSVEPDRIRYTGSIKFDPERDDTKNVDATGAATLWPQTQRNVLFGGSTHPGEEEMLARIFLRLRPAFPDLALFLAPRHVERAREVRRELENLSLGAKFTSELGSAADDTIECLILDRTGELRQWYRIASVVFVGKSLKAVGGQNPVEPIVAGKPVVFGPHMENFAALATKLKNCGGAIEVSDESSLEEVVRDLLSHSERQVALVDNARRVVDAHRGASRRTADLVINLSKMTAKRRRNQ